MDDIESSTKGFCAILSRDLIAQDRSLSFTYERPAESWSNSVQMYFGKQRASRINFVLEPLNFADDNVRGDNCRKRVVLKDRLDALFINLNYGGMARSPFLLASSFSGWYLVLQQSRMFSKCIWKVIPSNFN